MFGAADRETHYSDREAAYAVILDADRRVALVHGKQGLLLPGGGVDADEPPPQAVLRRVLEECGRPIEIVRAIGQAIQYCQGGEDPVRARHRFFEARFEAPGSRRAEYRLSWAHIDEVSRWLRHESHVWAVRTLLAETRP